MWLLMGQFTKQNADVEIPLAMTLFGNVDPELNNNPEIFRSLGR